MPLNISGLTKITQEAHCGFQVKLMAELYGHPSTPCVQNNLLRHPTRSEQSAPELPVDKQHHGKIRSEAEHLLVVTFPG